MKSILSLVFFLIFTGSSKSQKVIGLFETDARIASADISPSGSLVAYAVDGGVVIKHLNKEIWIQDAFLTFDRTVYELDFLTDQFLVIYEKETPNSFADYLNLFLGTVNYYQLQDGLWKLVLTENSYFNAHFYGQSRLAVNESQNLLVKVDGEPNTSNTKQTISLYDISVIPWRKVYDIMYGFYYSTHFYLDFSKDGHSLIIAKSGHNEFYLYEYIDEQTGWELSETSNQHEINTLFFLDEKATGILSYVHHGIPSFKYFRRTGNGQFEIIDSLRITTSHYDDYYTEASASSDLSHFATSTRYDVLASSDTFSYVQYCTIQDKIEIEHTIYNLTVPTDDRPSHLLSRLSEDGDILLVSMGNADKVVVYDMSVLPKENGGGLDENASLLYPNPCRETLIWDSVMLGEYLFEIVSIDGRIPMSGILGSNSRIDVNKLVPGAYFLRVRINAEDWKAYKFIKI